MTPVPVWLEVFAGQFETHQAKTQSLSELVAVYNSARQAALLHRDDKPADVTINVALEQKNKQIESQQALLNDLQAQLSAKERENRDLSSRLATSIAQALQLGTQLESTHKKLELKELQVISLENEIKGMQNADKIEIVEKSLAHTQKNSPSVSPTPGLAAMTPRRVSFSSQLGKGSLAPTVITASKGGPGPQIVAVGTRKLHCLNASSGGVVSEIDAVSSASSSACILSACISLENDSVLIGTSESQLSLLDLNGRLLKDLKGHSGKIKGCGFLANKSKAFSVSTDRTLKLWDLNRACPVRSVPVTSQLVGAVATQDGTMIVTCHLNGKLIVWSQTDKICEIDAHADACLGVCLSPDGRFISSLGKDDVCSVIDIHMAQSGPIHMLRGFKGLPIDAPPAISVDSKIVSLCANSGIHSWDLLLGSPLGSVPTDALALAWAPGCIGSESISQQVVTAHENGVVKWWYP